MITMFFSSCNSACQMSCTPERDSYRNARGQSNGAMPAFSPGEISFICSSSRTCWNAEFNNFLHAIFTAQQLTSRRTPCRNQLLLCWIRSSENNLRLHCIHFNQAKPRFFHSVLSPDFHCASFPGSWVSESQRYNFVCYKHVCLLMCLHTPLYTLLISFPVLCSTSWRISLLAKYGHGSRAVGMKGNT